MTPADFLLWVGLLLLGSFALAIAIGILGVAVGVARHFWREGGLP